MKLSLRKDQKKGKVRRSRFVDEEKEKKRYLIREERSFMFIDLLKIIRFSLF
jgi:hypothetical protein